MSDPAMDSWWDGPDVRRDDWCAALEEDPNDVPDDLAHSLPKFRSGGETGWLRLVTEDWVEGDPEPPGVYAMQPAFERFMRLQCGE